MTTEQTDRFKNWICGNFWPLKVTSMPQILNSYHRWF